MGVMSGVKYRLLEAIGVDISSERKEIDKAVSEIKLTPLQTELTMRNLSEKSKMINEFLDRILTGKDAKLTLKELLYGKKSYGKHVYTKCLYRAFLNAQEGESENISSKTKQCINANSEGCIGCPFLVAERFFLYEVEKRLSSAVDGKHGICNYFIENEIETIDKEINDVSDKLHSDIKALKDLVGNAENITRFSEKYSVLTESIQYQMNKKALLSYKKENLKE